jgi:hypothetical protein
MHHGFEIELWIYPSNVVETRWEPAQPGGGGQVFSGLWRLFFGGELSRYSGPGQATSATRDLKFWAQHNMSKVW